MKQKRQLDFTIPALAIPLFIAIIFNLPGCNKSDKANDKKTVYVEYFVNGQILLPDMAITDTLIVFDAKGLNEAIAPIEQGLKEDWAGDKAISDTFHKYCYTIKF